MSNNKCHSDAAGRIPQIQSKGSFDRAQDDRSKKGQTLVEALLSIAVAVIVVVALVGVGITAMRTANFGRDQAEAVRLAGQSLEIIRSQRDTDWTTFASNLQTNNCGSPGFCCLNSSSQIITYNSAGCLVNNFYDTSFNYNSASFDPAGLVTITTHVKFNEGQIVRDVTLTETFTNWRT